MVPDHSWSAVPKHVPVPSCTIASDGDSNYPLHYHNDYEWLWLITTIAVLLYYYTIGLLLLLFSSIAALFYSLCGPEFQVPGETCVLARQLPCGHRGANNNRPSLPPLYKYDSALCCYSF